MEKIVLKFCLLVLVCLAVMAVFNVDIAATKERVLIGSAKLDIDTTQNVDSLKLKAKRSLDAAVNERKAWSNKSLFVFWVLVPVCICMMWLNRRL